jgi:hypothetical protein
MELIQLSAIGTAALLLLEFCEICSTILSGTARRGNPMHTAGRPTFSSAETKRDSSSTREDNSYVS